MTTFYLFPYQTLGDLMMKYHLEVVMAERWDLTEESRMATVVCLN
jgi:hypothetical protein